MNDQSSSAEIIVAEIEISYTPNLKPSQRPKITSVEDAYQLLIDSWDKSKIELVEQFKVLLLNRANHVLGISMLTSGNITHTIADPKQVFALALKANAVQIILAHNHVAGSIIPSKADYELTYRMKTVGDFLELKVLDHIIVTVEGFYSFARAGIL